MKEECLLQGLSMEKLPQPSPFQPLGARIVLGSPVSKSRHKTENSSLKELNNLSEGNWEF